MGLRDLKKGMKDSWDGSVSDLRKSVDSVKDGVENVKGQSKEVARRTTKEGRAEAALEKQERTAAEIQGRQAAIDRAIEAANRGDIRAEEAAITEAFKFNGGGELVNQLATQGQLRRGGYIGSVGHGRDQMWIWRDRIVSSEGLFLMDEKTRASIDQAGNLSLAYRHTVTRSVLFSSNWQKQETADTRELYFLIEHPEWAKVVSVPPNFSQQVRQIAAQVNSAASAKAGAPAPPTPAAAMTTTPAAEDPLDRIKKLVELRDAGALTDEEFAQQKAKILNA